MQVMNSGKFPWMTNQVHMFQHTLWAFQVISYAVWIEFCTGSLATKIVEGLPGTEVMFDDFLIIGRGDTLKLAVIDHDQNLIKFLEPARERNLKLNTEKMCFRLQEIPFLVTCSLQMD